jgi:toxin ParE1/3/4
VTARLTPQAARDIDQILDYTLNAFGISQFRRYQSLLNQAIADIAETPLRGGSKKRAELGDNHRSWHIQLTGKRQGSASHIIFYYCLSPDPATDIVVLRILHESMDPKLHMD